LRQATNDGDAIGQAQVLAARDGPLAALLRTVVQQTSLHRASAASALSDAAAPLERLVEDRFAPLRQLMLQGADGRQPFDAALADFNELHVLRALAGSSSARGDEAATSLERLERIRADARRFPEPVRSMVLELAAPPPPRARAQAEGVSSTG
jgi:type VI protein secretion system component VasK